MTTGRAPPIKANIGRTRRWTRLQRVVRRPTVSERPPREPVPLSASSYQRIYEGIGYIYIIYAYNY